MSDFTPQPEPHQAFHFDGLTPETVSEDDAPAEFEAPKRDKWWQRKSLKNAAASASKPRKEKAKKPAAPMPRGGLRKPLEDLYTGIGMFMMPFDPGCGKILIEAAPACAESLDDLAKNNEAVRRILISLVTTSAMGAVVMAHAPIVMAMAMHHIPALKDRQEKMVGEFAEAMANMPMPDDKDSE